MGVPRVAAVTPIEWMVASAVVFAGASLQSLVGFGMNLVAVPLFLFAGWADFVPGPLLVVLVVQTLMLGIGERRHVDGRLLVWFVPGRLVGTAVGVVLLTRLSVDATTIVICVLVLASAAAIRSGWRVAPRPSRWVGAGLAAGFGNVVSSIGGPPLAIVLTDHHPAAQRATQGYSGAIGSLVSIAMLAAVGRFDGDTLRHGLALVPATVLGTLAPMPLRRRIPDADALRPWVWMVATGTAVVTLVRTVLR